MSEKGAPPGEHLPSSLTPLGEPLTKVMYLRNALEVPQGLSLSLIPNTGLWWTSLHTVHKVTLMGVPS